MRPARGDLLHFSEDPTITEFRPHLAATAQQPETYVWGVDAVHAPSYWLHAVEYTWLDRIRSVELYAYRLPAETFAPSGEPASSPPAHVSSATVRPLGPPEPVGDLLALHESAGIQLRVLPNLWDFWDAVIGSTLGFSGIRLRNAAPRPVS